MLSATTGSLGGRSLLWRWKFNSSTSGFGKTNSDRLFRGSRTMLSFSHVMHFLAHELACLRGRRLSRALVSFCSFDGLFLWHLGSFRECICISHSTCFSER